MHDYTCHFCKEITAEMSSWQYCLPGSGRKGYDYYYCRSCKKSYVIESDDKNCFPIETNESAHEFFGRLLLASVRDFSKQLESMKDKPESLSEEGD